MVVINDTRRLRDLEQDTLDRYNLVGPRYTSYPTAPEWTPEVGPDQVAAHLAAHRGELAGKPLSIYAHIPFCIERCTYCACNVIASPQMDPLSEPYVAQIEQEAELWSRLTEGAGPVIQHHWGGGTPTYLSPGQIRRVHKAMTDRFRFAPDAEQSIEIHVTWTSDDQIRLLAELGFNRISLGVQDFEEKVQEAIGRRQSFDRTREIVELARAEGFGGVNMDLVYGLPHQTAERFKETIDRVLELRPDRLAVYNFAFLPGRIPHQRAIDPATLPGTEHKFQILLETCDRFADAGYRYIGMDHFALPEDELAKSFEEGTMQRNFMGFTTRAGADLVGMGVSAISYLAGMYAQNTKKIPAWRKAIDTGRTPTERGLVLTRDDHIRRTVIDGLMCRDHVDKRQVERAFGIRFDDYFAEEISRLQPMIDDGLLTIGPDSLDLNFLGRLFVRNIAMVFDAYLKRGPQHTFSKTL